MRQRVLHRCQPPDQPLADDQLRLVRRPISGAETLNRLQVPDFFPVHASLDEALDAVFARPPYLRDELLLAPTLSAPAAARAFVQQVCRY